MGVYFLCNKISDLSEKTKDRYRSLMKEIAGDRGDCSPKGPSNETMIAGCSRLFDREYMLKGCLDDNDLMKRIEKAQLPPLTTPQ